MNLTNIKFIYFDLDDTLLNHTQAQLSALLDLHAHFSELFTVDVNQLIGVYRKINAAQWISYSEGKIDSRQLHHNRFELTLKQLGFNENQSPEVGAQYLQFYQDHWRWIDGAESAFNLIRHKYDVGILTNGFTEIQEKKFKQFQLANLTDQLIISEQTGSLKPQPAIFEYATELAGCQPEEIFYIGDSYQADITGGHNFGWKTAWFTQKGHQSQKNKVHFVFDDFKSLCNLLNI
jgi:putative hydrolase of the HAD superfamily